MAPSLAAVLVATCAACYGSLLVVGAGDVPDAADLGWQVHSWNDIREWPQLLQKSVLAPGYNPAEQRLYVKIDPHYMPSLFCDSQLRDLPRGPTKKGCTVLSHDVPLPVVNNYSTTDDVLATIQQQLASRGSLNVSLALCFKSSPLGVCAASPSEEASDWLGLVDGLLNRAAALQARYPDGGFEVVLDGDATPGGSTAEALARKCLFSRWGQFPSTYVPGRDPDEALHSDAGPLASFTFLNPSASASELHTLIGQDFGRFGASGRPLTFWEPSDEPTIHDLASEYVNATAARMEGGFLFATNQDPVQQELYLASVGNGTGRAWHGQLLGAAPGTSPAGLQPHTALLRPSNRLFVCWQSNSTTSGPVWQYSVSTEQLDDPVVAGPLPQLSAAQTLPFDVAAIAAGENETVVLTSSNRTTVVVSVNDDTSKRGRMVFATSAPTTGLSTPATALATAVLAPVAAPSFFELGELLLSLWPGSVPSEHNGSKQLDGCRLQYDVTEIQSGESVGTGCALNVSDTSGSAAMEAIASISVALLSADSANATSGTGCPEESVAALFTTTDNATNIFAGGLCITLPPRSNSDPPPHVVAVAPMPALAKPATLIDVGVGSQIHTTGTAVQEIHGDGFCWNMEARNKAPVPRLCDVKPSSTTAVLTYNIAPSVDAWIAAVNGAGEADGHEVGQPRVDVFSSCHPHVLHGAFGLGHRPSAVFFQSPSTARAVSVVVHEAWQGPTSTKDPCLDCGAAIVHPAGSLILDAWSPGSNHIF